MSTQPQSPDRRPLVYTAIGILILAIAAVLFWPRTAERGPDALVLTPEDLPASGEAAPPGQPVETTLRASEESVESAGPPEDAFPVEDAQLNQDTVVDATPPAADPPAAKPTPQEKAIPDDGPAPGTTGPYLLNVGSFGDRANADKLVARLDSQGVPARIATAEGQHGTVYRVQIGYSEGHSVAEAFGREVKRRAGVDFWVARR